MKTDPLDPKKDNRYPSIRSMLDEVLRSGLKNLSKPVSEAQAEAAIRWAFYAGFIHGQHVNEQMQRLSSATFDKLQAGYLAESTTVLKEIRTYHETKDDHHTGRGQKLNAQ